MASKSIFDELLGAIGGGGAAAGARGAGSGAGGAGGGLGDLLSQISGALGGGAQGGAGALGGMAGGGGLSDILGQLQGSLGSGTRELGGRVDEVVGDRGSFAKGAAAGGLMGALLGGKGTAKAAGAAVIGTLAWKAYQSWKAQQQAAAPQDDARMPDARFLPVGAAAEQLSDKLARAMVAAAKADGKVTSMERQRILGALSERGVGAEAQRIVEEELARPLDVGHIAAMAATPEEAVQIYTASLLAIDPEEPEEAAYLEALAERLGLDADLVAHLHQTAGA